MELVKEHDLLLKPEKKNSKNKQLSVSNKSEVK